MNWLIELKENQAKRIIKNCFAQLVELGAIYLTVNKETIFSETFQTDEKMQIKVTFVVETSQTND